MDPHESALDDETVVAVAAAAGFRLVQYETGAGQPVWEWRRGDEPRPQFVTRRIAIHWMTEVLARERAVAFAFHGGATPGSYGIVKPSARRLDRAARSQDARIFMADVNITPSVDGPYLVFGRVGLTDVDGREIPHPDQMAICRCGHSNNKPFCDGTHATIDFDGTLKN